MNRTKKVLAPALVAAGISAGAWARATAPRAPMNNQAYWRNSC